MAKRIYVENLPSDITEERLKEMFAQIGEIQSVKIKTHLFTKQPTGSGIVKMTLDVDTYRAVNCFEGATIKNGKIHLKEEEPLIEKAKDALTDIADGYERVSSKIATDIADGYERVSSKSSKIATDITDSYERVSTKLAKEIKEIEHKIEDKIDEIKKH